MIYPKKKIKKNINIITNGSFTINPNSEFIMNCQTGTSPYLGYYYLAPDEASETAGLQEAVDTVSITVKSPKPIRTKDHWDIIPKEKRVKVLIQRKRPMSGRWR
jgi:hypothetical protein